MLVWATEFPLEGGKGVSELLNIVKQWLVGSPHAHWQYSDFQEEPWGDITTYSSSGQTLRVACIRADGAEWIGAQLTWTEDGRRDWTAEIIGRDSENTLWVAVRVDCNLLNPGDVLPKPRKPYIIRILMQKLPGGKDAGIRISEKPLYLREYDVDLAANLITGKLGNRLPIVYVSAGYRGKPYVDPERLVRHLSGMAHVVVEPSRYFSFTLARHVEGNNPYGGAIAIYWPGGGQERLLPSNITPTQMLTWAIDTVRTALTRIRPTSELTWSYLQEIISRARIEELKAIGSTEVDEYVAAFDAELAAKDERLRSAERELARLAAENAALKARASVATSILSPGNEQEFYPGEIRDVIVYALRAAVRHLPPGSRPAHVIEDVLRANAISDLRSSLADEIKNAVSRMDKFGREERSTLESLGFDIEDAGKHIKARYHGDDRYQFVIAKTAGDRRSSKNLASQIVRTLFG